MLKGMAHWKNPEYRERQLVLRATPEHRAKQSVGVKRKWQDPAYRAKQAGRKMPPAVKETLRQANLGRKLTAEHREKLRQAKLGKKGTLSERFWRRVRKDEPDACWMWEGAVTERAKGYGYGFFGIAGRGTVGAHRLAYELSIGPIPQGLVINHLCYVTLCVNPAHLEATTQRRNVLYSPSSLPAINAKKTHCKHGHPFDKANTARCRDGSRRCKACAREGWRRKNGFYERNP